MSAHKLANMYINKGLQITAVEVNNVLAFSGISVTQNELDSMLKIPLLVFSNLDSNTIRSDKFLQYIGTVRSKAIQVNVTNVIYGQTVIYSSMREAALSFAPEYITTGPTVKTYADTGKLFKEKYKITYSKNNN
jgi:hypothetical protein